MILDFFRLIQTLVFESYKNIFFSFFWLFLGHFLLYLIKIETGKVGERGGDDM